MDAIINDLSFINNVFTPLNLIGSIFIFSLNGLILYVLFNRLKFDSIELKFILFLCILEIIIGIDYFVLSILKLYYGHTFFAPNNIPCIAFGFFTSWAVRYEFIVVTVLALWRYLLVVHEIQLNMRLLVIYTIVGISPITAIFLYGLTNIDARPGASYIMCSPITTPGQSSVILNVMSTILLLLPCWIITYCYFVIGWKANKKLNLMKIEAEAENNDAALKSIKHQKFSCCVTYFMRLTIGYKRPPFFDAVIFEMGLSTVVLNPIVTVSFQPEVNNEIVFLFVKLRARIEKFLRNLTTNQ
ncbi:hypothetical protein CONCODRAFT_2763 [Conidiobolus coronatus NRRL 28638]|uniref:G-protein coupled receptors family 1 profile domain-containing protein n=1 Tax=Conidiobolus coronatus (strain ATCC 28846 / CBS 209.66 / NRRL 28638) TaxID=796925 RepID=A0A137PGW2_CONC2|nr:hypothetical protein CONCODRAFT_2763 [Conidiobolus coronatus NRRL 28638]|eukprot:KXN74228.1 hypothetical protein CONCODRAFT_2763 [Conidiobolus coronatus NRRL 28638]